MRKPRKPFFERLQASMEEALEFAQNKRKLRVTEFIVPDPPRRYTAADVQQLRERLGLSQSAFAHFLHVSSNTVQSWEQGLGSSHVCYRDGQCVSPVTSLRGKEYG